jgi:hypothetical protein
VYPFNESKTFKSQNRPNDLLERQKVDLTMN